MIEWLRSCRSYFVIYDAKRDKNEIRARITSSGLQRHAPHASHAGGSMVPTCASGDHQKSGRAKSSSPRSAPPVPGGSARSSASSLESHRQPLSRFACHPPRETFVCRGSSRAASRQPWQGWSRHHRPRHRPCPAHRRPRQARRRPDGDAAVSDALFAQGAAAKGESQSGTGIKMQSCGAHPMHSPPLHRYAHALITML